MYSKKIVLGGHIMLPTFSVNPEAYLEEKQKKIMEMINALYENPLNAEWIGEAYIKVVEDSNVENINLSGYSVACDRNTKLNKKRNKNVSILTSEEQKDGFVGIVDVVADFVEDNMDEIIDNLDLDYYIDTFKDTRQRLYFEKGHDIWRLIWLAKKDNDKQAQMKLRVLMDECGIRDLLYYVLTKTECFEKLASMLERKTEGIVC